MNLIAFLWNYFWPVPSVNTVMSDFIKIEQKLEKVAKLNQERWKKLDIKAEQINKARSVAVDEHRRAREVRERIQALVK
jgi:predicted metal-dependent hydrolase